MKNLVKRSIFTPILGIALIAFTLGGGTKAEAATTYPALAGNWAGEGSSTFALCYNSTYSGYEDCSTAPNTAFFNETLLFQGAVAQSGVGCYTTNVTNGPQFPVVPVSPATAFTVIYATKVISYNTTTKSGTFSFTAYLAGSGTSCNGSVLVNTANAPVFQTGTDSFVLSVNGSRSDSIVLTIQGSPISNLEDYVGHNVVFKQ